jgi:hypothetical protein
MFDNSRAKWHSPRGRLRSPIGSGRRGTGQGSTGADKPIFGGAFRRDRGLIPASGYYE